MAHQGNGFNFQNPGPRKNPGFAPPVQQASMNRFTPPVVQAPLTQLQQPQQTPQLNQAAPIPQQQPAPPTEHTSRFSFAKLPSAISAFANTFTTTTTTTAPKDTTTQASPATPLTTGQPTENPTQRQKSTFRSMADGLGRSYSRCGPGGLGAALLFMVVMYSWLSPNSGGSNPNSVGGVSSWTGGFSNAIGSLVSMFPIIGSYGWGSGSLPNGGANLPNGGANIPNNGGQPWFPNGVPNQLPNGGANIPNWNPNVQGQFQGYTWNGWNNGQNLPNGGANIPNNWNGNLPNNGQNLPNGGSNWNPANWNWGGGSGNNGQVVSGTAVQNPNTGSWLASFTGQNLPNGGANINSHFNPNGGLGNAFGFPAHTVGGGAGAGAWRSASPNCENACEDTCAIDETTCQCHCGLGQEFTRDGDYDFMMMHLEANNPYMNPHVAYQAQFERYGNNYGYGANGSGNFGSIILVALLVVGFFACFCNFCGRKQRCYDDDDC